MCVFRGRRLFCRGLFGRDVAFVAGTGFGGGVDVLEGEEGRFFRERLGFWGRCGGDIAGVRC